MNQAPATLSELLDLALELPEGERATWLESLPDTHAQLKPRLRALLARAAQVETSDFLVTLPKLGVLQPGGIAATEAPGDEIGPYRLVREIGAGGMGSVWLAERKDGTLRRQVALKFLRTQLPRAGLAERLERERDILASLIHPHIARLYDAGVSADGLPFLALEYIEGRQIDAYCRDEALDTRARLGLFLQVARAVAYAHGKLVVHRDLKPANILVSGDAQVHLLDFGIAKLLEDGRAVETHLTQLAGRAFTPEYASPEQIRGEAITTASDVYSLGVVLYELLTDSRPYALKRNSRGALEDAILESEPRRPSDCAAAPDTRRALRGDVDAVVLKALKKAPEERYATVNAFAEDVERLLAGLPVTAQPDSVAYRLRRFVARNKLGVAAASVVVVAVLGGAVVAFWQARVALHEKRRAEEVRSFIESIFIDADPAGTSGRPLSAVELLRQANARVATLRTTDPEQRLELLNTLALAMINLRDLDGAEAVLRDALALSATLDPSALPVLRAHRLRARLHVARSEPELAKREIAQVMPRLMQRPQRHVAELLAAMLARTEAYNAHADYEGALTSARDMIDTGRNLGVERSPDLVAGLIQLSYAHDYLNQHPQALDASRRAYEMSRALFPDATAHPVVNGARMQYAVALVRADEAGRGLELMREAEREAMAVFGPQSRIAAEIAFKMNQYLGRGGFVKEEIASIEKAMRILGPGYSQDSLAYAALLDNLGGSYLSVRDAARSLPASTRAREIVVAQLGEQHESAFVIQVARARAIAMLGDTARALQLLRPIVANYEGGPGVNTPLHFLGFVTRLHGDAAQAAKMQEQVLANVKARRMRSRALVELGLARVDSGQLQAAREPLAEAKAVYDELFPAMPPSEADLHVAYARLELAENRPQTALTHARTADAYWRDLDPQNRWAGEAALWLGRSYHALGRKSEAAEALGRAEKILAASRIPIDRDLLALARER